MPSSVRGVGWEEKQELLRLTSWEEKILCLAWPRCLLLAYIYFSSVSSPHPSKMKGCELRWYRERLGSLTFPSWPTVLAGTDQTAGPGEDRPQIY